MFEQKKEICCHSLTLTFCCNMHMKILLKSFSLFLVASHLPSSAPNRITGTHFLLFSFWCFSLKAILHQEHSELFMHPSSFILQPWLAAISVTFLSKSFPAWRTFPTSDRTNTRKEQVSWGVRPLFSWGGFLYRIWKTTFRNISLSRYYTIDAGCRAMGMIIRAERERQEALA